MRPRRPLPLLAPTDEIIGAKERAEGTMDQMEDIWRDVAPENDANTQQPDRVLDTGREAYLRTKQVLDEASAVSSMLFLDAGDSISPERYDRQQHQAAFRLGENSLDAPASAGFGDRVPGNGKASRASTLFGERFPFFHAGEAGGGGGSDGGDGEVSGGLAGGVLAAAGGRSSRLGVVDIRPEEKGFCKAFLELQSLLQSLPPGARARPEHVLDILRDMHEVSSVAEASALDSAARLRELRGSGFPAVAVAAATAHELSLEKDTWALLLYMNGAEKRDEEIKEEMRQKEEEASNSIGSGGPRIHAPPGPNTSDQAVLDHMRNEDWEFRRTEAVVEWLQDAARDRLKARGQVGGRSGSGSGHHLGWSNTLESLAVGGGNKSEVDQMHPDANLRKVGGGGGGGPGRAGTGAGLRVMRLVGQDDLDEEELLRTVWQLVRAGELSKAMRLCESGGQPWRAAAIGGGGVVGTNKIIEGENESDLEDIEEGYGADYSPAQGLWQEMCWQLSASLERGADSSEGPARSVAKHEAALFAHLAGNSGLLLDSDLTQSWEDQAWVRFTALLHVKVLEERIRHRRTQAMLSSLYPGVGTLRTDEGLLNRMLGAYPPLNHSAIFEVLDDNSRGRVRAEGKGVYRQAQQALVLGDKDIPVFLRNILWRVAASAADEEGGSGYHGNGGTLEVFPSPQLLRFAAHLALLLAAQCPYLTTMEEETVEAIEDVVSAYTQHLAKTHQVSLVATYAATLPTRRRRELYATFLRSVSGDGSRREALEQAKKHIPTDVPAILKKVVEDVRLQTVSVGPASPRHVPEGDMKKIRAMSWLVEHQHPDSQAEAVVQANALARHLVLQKYQQSAIGGRSAVEGGGLPWAAPPGDGSPSNDGDAPETPVILSARLEAVKTLLDAVSSQGGEPAAGVGDDDSRERECWVSLLKAREAYIEWGAACRAWEGDGSGARRGQEAEAEAEAAVRDAAERAVEAMEAVLTFEDGWMYPAAKHENTTLSFSDVDIRGAPPADNAETSSLGSWEHVDFQVERDAAVPANSGGVVGGGGGEEMVEVSMVVSSPMDEEDEGWERWKRDWGRGDELVMMEERRKAKEVAQARQRREREEEESVREMEEVARRAGEAARKEELLSVREACLPGLVFLAHEVAHNTGLLMLRWGFDDAAPEWFTRAQMLATTIVQDKYRTLLAMAPAQMERFLRCVERSTTKLLGCWESHA